MIHASARNCPELSVVILTRDAGPRFSEVLAALFRCRGIENAEVLVIDSGSNDGTAELAEARPGVRLVRIPPEEFGHGRTRNLGASLASGRTLIFLVQDATPTGPELLERLTEPLARNPRVAASFGRQVARPEASPVEAEFLRRTYPDEPTERGFAASGEPATIERIFFSNVCSAIRREVWERFPFDETLIMSEDQKWARDVLESGYRIVYQPRASVLHSHSYGLLRVLRRNFDSGHSLVGVTENPWHSMIGYEIRFLGSAAAGLWHRGEARWIPWLLVHELVRSLGFGLGRYSRFIPGVLRRHLSLHPAYWRRSRRSAPPSGRRG